MAPADIGDGQPVGRGTLHGSQGTFQLAQGTLQRAQGTLHAAGVTLPVADLRKSLTLGSMLPLEGCRAGRPGHTARGEA
ncbi:hypothetical protein [Prevotella dentalis]|uniref:hypothetical protein n=1 Tax=Prevotella dentalis TaxID=52227 RepID=UPI002658091A|nr:hypothetical protein [Prevotella dentalis]MCF2636395.1 hypothetical protein [Prevotella dentalis]